MSPELAGRFFTTEPGKPRRLCFKLGGGRGGSGYSYLQGASLVAQLVKNLPAVWETWVQSLGREDPLQEGMATHSSIFTWRIPMDRGVWHAIVHGVLKNQHDWLSKHSTQHQSRCAHLFSLSLRTLGGLQVL